MPRISAFYGVEIYMYFRDHAPPHFHAIYGELEAAVSIQTGDVIEGQLPKTAKKLVTKWARLYLPELMTDWELAREEQPLNWIPPLD